MQRGSLSKCLTTYTGLGYHPHVHLLITGGGITADGQHWEPARGEFLVSVAVLFRKITVSARDFQGGGARRRRVRPTDSACHATRQRRLAVRYVDRGLLARR